MRQRARTKRSDSAMSRRNELVVLAASLVFAFAFALAAGRVLKSFTASFVAVFLLASASFESCGRDHATTDLLPIFLGNASCSITNFPGFGPAISRETQFPAPRPFAGFPSEPRSTHGQDEKSRQHRDDQSRRPSEKPHRHCIHL